MLRFHHTSEDVIKITHKHTLAAYKMLAARPFDVPMEQYTIHVQKNNTRLFRKLTIQQLDETYHILQFQISIVS